jgi:hypothetical protein
MPTRPIQRLTFAQGGQCFFCRKPLPKSEASVEHLVALTHGGKDNDENCVVCCKALNNMFGRMSLKEKLQILLNQKGEFVCPAKAPAALTVAQAPTAKHKTPRTHVARLGLVVTDLHKRGNARPGTSEKLLNTIRTYLTQIGEPPTEAEALLSELSAKRYVVISGGKVTYALPPKPPNPKPT